MELTEAKEKMKCYQEKKKLNEKINRLNELKKQHPADEKLLDELIEIYKERIWR